MKTIFFLAFFSLGIMNAQVTQQLFRTSLPNSVGINDTQVTISGAVPIIPDMMHPAQIYIDTELMNVLSVQTTGTYNNVQSNTVLTVQRGYAGSSAIQHNPGALVYFGYAYQFVGSSLTGACQPGSAQYVNYLAQLWFNCVAGNWVSAPTVTASGGGGNVSTGGTLPIGNLVSGAGTQAVQDSGIPIATLTTATNSQTLTNKLISGAANTLSNIPNSALVNSQTTVNGQPCLLGGSCSVTVSLPITSALIKGNNGGGGLAAVLGVDYQGGFSQIVGLGTTNTSIATTTAACTLLAAQCVAQIPSTYSGMDRALGFSLDFTVPDQAAYQNNIIIQDQRYGIASYYSNNFGYTYSNQASTVSQAFVSSAPVTTNNFNSFQLNKFSILESGHFDSGNTSNFQGYNDVMYATTPGQLIGHGTSVSGTYLNDVLATSNGVFCAQLGYPSFAEGCGPSDFFMTQGVPFNGTMEFQAGTNSAGTNLHTINLNVILQGAEMFGSHGWLVDTTVTPLSNTATSWAGSEFGPTPAVVTFGSSVAASTAAGTVATAVTFPTYTITNATNASPIVITTSAAHGFTSGQQVAIVGVKNTVGYSNANNLWIVTVIDTTHFSLNGSAGTGTYSAGGTATPATVTVNVSPTLTTGTISGFSTSALACVADPNSEPEMILPSAVGSTVTMTFHQPHGAGYYIGTGGLCGYIIENNADAKTQASFPEQTNRYSGANITGTIHPKTWMIISSTTSTATVAVQAKGYWRQVALNSDYSSSNNGVTMWKAAKVLMVSTTPGLDSALPNPTTGTAGGPIAVADNSITVTSGDTFTEFIGAVVAMTGPRSLVVNWSGNLTGAGGGGSCGGTYGGIMTSGDSECTLSNETNPLHYQPLGGSYLPPSGIHLKGDHVINHWDDVGGQYFDYVVGCPVDGCTHTLHPVVQASNAAGSWTITGATNATPIVITTSAANTIGSGDLVSISGVGGNTAANGYWIAFPITTTTFSIYSAIGNAYAAPGNGAYTSGGTATDNSNSGDVLGMNELFAGRNWCATANNQAVTAACWTRYGTETPTFASNTQAASANGRALGYWTSAYGWCANDYTGTAHCVSSGGGGGTVTTISAPATIFSIANPTTTPALSYATGQTADQILGTYSGTVGFGAIPSCSGASNAITYNTATHAFGCNTISGSGSGTVTSFAAPSASWPTWLVPTVATSTTTPSLTVTATAQGNGGKVQLSTGSTTTNDCVKFDVNGNTVDAGAACGSGGGSSSINNGLGTTATVSGGATQINVSMSTRCVGLNTTACPGTTTDTILASDAGGLVIYNNSSGVAVALPQANSGGNFLPGAPITITNYGTGSVTVTASTSYIGPASAANSVRVITGTTGSGSTSTFKSCTFVASSWNVSAGVNNYDLKDCN